MRLRLCGRQTHARRDTRTSLAEFKNASVVSDRSTQRDRRLGRKGDVSDGS